MRDYSPNSRRRVDEIVTFHSDYEIAMFFSGTQAETFDILNSFLITIVLQLVIK